MQPYEVVKSAVASTCLLDGCWVSIYHWSDDEARHFNPGLRCMTDEGWKQQVYSMHKIGITSIRFKMFSTAALCQPAQNDCRYL